MADVEQVERREVGIGQDRQLADQALAGDQGTQHQAPAVDPRGRRARRSLPGPPGAAVEKTVQLLEGTSLLFDYVSMRAEAVHPWTYFWTCNLSLATAAHQGWSANLFTLASDMFPRRAVGSVVGLGGMAGAVGGMLIAKVTGYVLQFTGSYVTVFLIAGCAYLTALAIMQVLSPNLEPAPLA